MIHVHKISARPSPEIVKEYSEKVATATAHEASGRQGAMASRIKPIAKGMKVCGPAFTMLCRGKDNLMIHKAIATAQPGDVLVVAIDDPVDAGFWGELLTISAMARRIAGLVIDGCVRDSEPIIKRGFPVFSRGVSIKGTTKQALGLINHPLVCGEVLVHPGDLVLGDDDGVVVVARERAEEVLRKSIERVKNEEVKSARLGKGETTLEMDGLDKVLANLGMVEE